MRKPSAMVRVFTDVMRSLAVRPRRASSAPSKEGSAPKT